MTVTGNAGPVAAASSDVTSGKTPLAVTFDGSGSTDAFTHDDLLSGDMRVNGASQSPADFLAEAAASCEP